MSYVNISYEIDFQVRFSAHLGNHCCVGVSKLKLMANVDQNFKEAISVVCYGSPLAIRICAEVDKGQFY